MSNPDMGRKPAKQAGFGLLLKKAPPKESKIAPPSKLSGAVSSAFGDSDESDEDVGGTTIKAADLGQKGKAGVNHLMLLAAQKNKTNAKTKAKWAEAMKQDASIFQYDEVYDNMEKQKGVEALRKQELKDVDSQPKYIYQLMDAAKKKKLRDQLRDDRIAQKEREQEGEEFADKEAFVTGKYREEMEKMKKLAEEDRLKEIEEERNDVKKRGDLTDLYRNLYKGTDPSPTQAAANKDIDGKQDPRPTKRHKNDKVVRGPSKVQPVQKVQSAVDDNKPDPTKYARKATDEAIDDAKARYLARKAAKAKQKRVLPTFDA